MAVIKISNKNLIDNLQAKLILRLGRKITQQETLDLCVEYANAHFDDILQMVDSEPILTPEKAEKILKTFEKYNDTYYDPDAKFESDLDNDAYSL
jgi:hypothetical protein